MRLGNVQVGTIILGMSDCMEKFLGVHLLCPSEIMGEYFEKGVYKTLSFSDMMHLLVDGHPLPSTFAKWYSLKPLYAWLEPNVILPGHLDHYFRSGH